MSAKLNIITPDHIKAYAKGELAGEDRRDVEDAIRDDDRAARAYRTAKKTIARANRVEEPVAAGDD